MIIDKVRLKRQAEIVKNWANNFNCQGTLEAVTGFGKTMVGRIAHAWALQHKESSITVVIVPTTALKEQWEDIAIESNWKNYRVWTIQSFIKQKIIICDLLILDEIHMYRAEQFSRCFEIADYSWVLGLTATLSKDHENQGIIDRYAPMCDEITLKEALDEGWINEYRVYNIGVKLDTESRILYDQATKNFGTAMGFFEHDFDLMMKCYTKKKWREEFARLHNDDWVTPKTTWLMARKGLDGMRNRKTLLYNYPAKLDLAVSICREHPERKIVVFGQSIKSADYISKSLGTVAEAYHSKIRSKTVNGKKIGPAKVKKDILARFCKIGVQLYVLVTAKALDMGIDIPVLDTGIVIAGTSKMRQFIQRLGRIVRIMEGKTAVWIEIYVLDSQDVRWLEQRQTGVPRNLIKTIEDPSEIQWN